MGASHRQRVSFSMGSASDEKLFEWHGGHTHEVTLTLTLCPQVH